MIIKPPVSSGSSTEILETKDTITTAQLLRKANDAGVIRAKSLWGTDSYYDFDTNLATGYCSYGSFNSNLISGRSDNINVVPYVSLV